jgi:hypothetical protein
VSGIYRDRTCAWLHLILDGAVSVGGLHTLTGAGVPLVTTGNDLGEGGRKGASP